MTRRALIALVVFVVVLGLWLWMLATPSAVTAQRVAYDLSTSVNRGVQGCVEFHATGTVSTERHRGVARERVSNPSILSPILQVSLRESCGYKKREADAVELEQYWWDSSCKAALIKQITSKPQQTPDCGKIPVAVASSSYGPGWRFTQSNDGPFATWDSSSTRFRFESTQRLCVRGAAVAKIKYAGSYYDVVSDLGRVCA